MLYLEFRVDNLGMCPRTWVSGFGGVRGLEEEGGRGEEWGVSPGLRRRPVRLGLQITPLGFFPPRTWNRTLSYDVSIIQGFIRYLCIVLVLNDQTIHLIRGLLLCKLYWK